MRLLLLLVMTVRVLGSNAFCLLRVGIDREPVSASFSAQTLYTALG
jgi:hypothetical protein